MNWFKHYVNASDDIRVFRLKDEMGYTGLGMDEVVQQNEAVSILLKKIRKHHVP